MYFLIDYSSWSVMIRRNRKYWRQSAIFGTENIDMDLGGAGNLKFFQLNLKLMEMIELDLLAVQLLYDRSHF
jgi:hypothetical protein